LDPREVFDIFCSLAIKQVKSNCETCNIHDIAFNKVYTVLERALSAIYNL